MENTLTNQPISQRISGFLEKHSVIYQFLRFACIGFLNAALNFLVLNSVSKALNISQGWPLGGVEVLAFLVAILQSYTWNKTWTFGRETGVSLWQNIIRLFLVGLLGALTVGLIFISSRFSPPFYFYLVLLAVYLIFETVLWKAFGFHLADWDHQDHSFVIFFIVTLIGLGINAALTSVISSHLHLTHSDLDKNLSLALATGVSLFWNFVGYKVVVFKK